MKVEGLKGDWRQITMHSSLVQPPIQWA